MTMMRFICLALAAAASLASGAYAAPPRAAASPETATIPLKPRPGDSGFANFLTVQVGDGRPGDVLLDTGSTGLRIRADAIGPAVKLTNKRFSYSFSSGNVLNGVLGYAVVSFPGSSPHIATTKPIAIQVVQQVTCQAEKPHCPGWKPSQIGVMGVAYSPLPVFNPLVQLPGNLATGFIVVADNIAEPAVTPHLDVGLTPQNSRNFARVPFARADRPQRNGLPAWNTKSVPTCFRVNGGPPGCFATVFDTGASIGSFETPGLGPEGLYKPVPSGASVTTEVKGALSLTVRAGNRPWVDSYRYEPPHGSVKGYNSGGLVFRHYRVLFDAVRGEIGFSPPRR